ncbi:hypothetical protein L0F63_005806 [Massospora cicadina]|nr:hypothetical protein L0F63_005806 [Massospora cicadina]
MSGRNYGERRVDEAGEDLRTPLLSQEDRDAERTLGSSWLDVFETKGGRYTYFGALGLGTLIALGLLLAGWFRGLDASGVSVGAIPNVPISNVAIRAGWLQCKALSLKRDRRKAFFDRLRAAATESLGARANNASVGRRNPRAEPNTPSVIIRSVTVWDGLGNSYSADVLLRDGIIAEIGKYLHIPKDAKVIQGRDKVLTPGIVDMHSHIGVDSWPELRGSDDTNEMTRPTFPQLRTLDAFNPKDEAIAWARSGGVTTSLVLPGSGNLMGGEAFVFKLRTLANLSVEASLAQAGFKWRYMKFACGENPKRVYSEKGQTPTTRMGNAYLFREKFAEASKLVARQDEWCNHVDSFSEGDILGGKANRVFERFPEDLKLESLSQVLRGNVQPHIHCYETEDLEALVRISEEFGFQIWAFHHALEAYRVPDLIHRAGRNGFNVTVATFADGWGYKKEAYLGTPTAPQILARHKVPVAFKSDHPVINSQQLMYEATKAFHYGLDPAPALAALTSVPAKALGLSHRIGHIAVGMDADVVLWDAVPLTVGAHPVQVFIDGLPQIPSLESLASPHANSTYDSPIPMPVRRRAPSCDARGHRTFVLEGLRQIVLNATYAFTRGNLDMRVVCQVAQNDGPRFNLGGDAWIIPGLIGVSTKLGLNEIDQEASTGDGYVANLDLAKPDAFPRAFDGLRFGGKHLEAAFQGGITAAISAPLDRSGVVAGYGVAFYTDGTGVSNRRDIAREVSSFHVNLGGAYFTKETKAVSLQLAQLRAMLLGAAASDRNRTLYKVVSGQIPLVVRAENADDIARLIRLRSDVRSAFVRAGGVGKGLDLILIGGAESWKVADRLAEAAIPVILQPARCTPSDWSRRRCLPGPPLTADSTLTALHRAGVVVGLAPDEDAEYARDLIFEASWAHSDARGACRISMPLASSPGTWPPCSTSTRPPHLSRLLVPSARRSLIVDSHLVAEFGLDLSPPDIRA